MCAAELTICWILRSYWALAKLPLVSWLGWFDLTSFEHSL